MLTISQLTIYPIKSCAGIALDAARLLPSGLEYDRNWMLIDAAGQFITQRICARLALITVEMDERDLIVRAPGMTVLRVPLAVDAGAARVQATVWKHTVSAFDAGAADWFSHYLGSAARLARFDPAQQRLASHAWTGSVNAPVQFADAYPLLIVGQASLDELNARLMSKGVEPVPMNRFRPNLVIEGLLPYEEDHVLSFRGQAEDRSEGGGEDGGEIELRVVKPCARCPIPAIDQMTGAPNPRWPNEPLDTLQSYRADARLNGAITFGQNAIVMQGAHMRVGQQIEAQLNFS